MEQYKRQADEAGKLSVELEKETNEKKIEAMEANAPRFDDIAQVLFDQALLAEGGLPNDPAAYVRRVNALLL